MNKKYLFLFSFILLRELLLAQSMFYYYNNDTIKLKYNTRYIYLSTADENNIIHYAKQFDININDETINDNLSFSNTQKRYWTKIDLNENLPEEQYLEYLSKINKTNCIIEPYFYLDGRTIGLTEYFFVKIKKIIGVR